MADIKINNEVLTFDKVIYLNANAGSDTAGDGSMYSPYQTLNKAIQDHNGSTAFIMAGGIYESVNINSSDYVGPLAFIGQGINTVFKITGTLTAYSSSDNVSAANLYFYDLVWDGNNVGSTNFMHCETTWEFHNIVFTNIRDCSYSYFLPNDSAGPKPAAIYMYNCIKTNDSTSFLRCDVGTIQLTNCYGNFTSGYETVQSDWDYQTNIITSTPQLDSEYNITETGWEHTGTGTNPDGTQANIGVYGGLYTWKDWSVLYLFNDNGEIKSYDYNNLIWNTLGQAPVTKTMFDNGGVENIQKLFIKDDIYSLAHTLNDGSDHINCVSVDNNYIYAACEDDNGYIYDRTDFSLVKVLGDASANLYSIRSDENYIYTSSFDQNVYIYNKSDFSLYKTLSDASDRVVIDYIDNNYIYAHSLDNYVYIYDKTDFTLENDLNMSGGVSAVFGDENYLYVGLTNIYVYNKTDWSLVDTLTGPTDTITTLKLDNNYLYAGSVDYNTYIYQKSKIGTTPAPIDILSDGNSYAYDLTLDDTYFYIGKWNDNIYVYEKSNIGLNPTPVTVINNNDTAVQSLTNDSNYIYVGCRANGNIHIYSKPSMIVPIEQLQSQQVTILAWTDELVDNKVFYLNAIPPNKLILPNDDIDLSSISSIDSITLSSTQSGNGVIRLIVSADGGSSWYSTKPHIGYYTENLIPAMTANTAPEGEASASSRYNSSYPAWKAFDRDNSDTYCWLSGASTGWLQYKFSTAQKINKYIITSRNNSSQTRAPLSWMFQGSNNNNTWVDLHTVLNEPVWGADETREYTFTNTDEYQYYRINCSEAQGSGEYIAIGELQMQSHISQEASGEWYEVDISDLSNIKQNGMTPQDIVFTQSSYWNNLISGTNKIRFGYYLELNSNTDVAETDLLEMTVDMRGKWRSAYKDEYNYKYNYNDTMIVRLLADGTYKINY